MAAAILLSLAFSALAFDDGARASAIYEPESGTFLFEKNADERRLIASTTKIMTAVVVMEHMKMNKKARISRRAARTPYRNLYMKRGDRYYVRDLFKAMMVSSCFLLTSS